MMIQEMTGASARQGCVERQSPGEKRRTKAPGKRAGWLVEFATKVERDDIQSRKPRFFFFYRFWFLLFSWLKGRGQGGGFVGMMGAANNDKDCLGWGCNALMRVRRLLCAKAVR